MRASLNPLLLRPPTYHSPGEWEGITASFDAATGAPLPLPEHYVPDAFREWGVELFDWQSQCSSTVHEGRALAATVRRLMPTVGCEADAVAFTEEATAAAASGGDGNGGGDALAVLPDGSYSAGPAAFDLEAASKLRLEACFAAPGVSLEGAPAAAPAPASGAAAAPRYRLKVAHNLARDWRDGSWRVTSVELHRER